jgi:hypothetical protein
MKKLSAIFFLFLLTLISCYAFAGDMSFDLRFNNNTSSAVGTSSSSGHYLLIDNASHYLLVDGLSHKLKIDGAS